jgi:hypothetical protein
MAFIALVGALLPLNSLGHYIHWGWIQISVANFTVIILMVVVFVVALFAPFPGRHKSESDREL